MPDKPRNAALLIEDEEAGGAKVKDAEILARYERHAEGTQGFIHSLHEGSDGLGASLGIVLPETAIVRRVLRRYCRTQFCGRLSFRSFEKRSAGPSLELVASHHAFNEWDCFLQNMSSQTHLVTSLKTRWI
jgi:hypothetical protein